MTHNRLDPASLTSETLDALSEMFAEPGHVSLVDEEGRSVALPTPLFSHLVNIVRLMAEKRTVVLVPEDEECTTQAAADHLGVSRQHLVNLLEDGEIPFHKVGTHRRVKFRDVLAYQKKRDKERHAALNRLADKVDEAGLYDGSYAGDSSENDRQTDQPSEGEH